MQSIFNGKEMGILTGLILGLILASCIPSRETGKQKIPLTREQLEILKIDKTYRLQFKDNSSLKIRILWNRKDRIQGVVMNRIQRGGPFNQTYDYLIDNVVAVNSTSDTTSLIWPIATVALYFLLLGL